MCVGGRGGGAEGACVCMCVCVWERGGGGGGPGGGGGGEHCGQAKTYVKRLPTLKIVVFSFGETHCTPRQSGGGNIFLIGRPGVQHFKGIALRGVGRRNENRDFRSKRTIIFDVTRSDKRVSQSVGLSY